MEILNIPGKQELFPNPTANVLYLRAVLQGVVEKHFGSGIVDELFELYGRKVADSSFFFDPENQDLIVIFVLLRRKMRT